MGDPKPNFNNTQTLVFPCCMTSARTVCVSVMQAGIDLMGVVTDVGQLGSVKRKSDNSELSRRDITLLDTRCSTPLPVSVLAIGSNFPWDIHASAVFHCLIGA